MFLDSSKPTLEQHTAWMCREIQSDRSRFFIGALNSVDVGYVRFERGTVSKDITAAFASFPNLWNCSLAVEASKRGQGFGSEMFQLAEVEFLNMEKIRPLTLLTWARPDNHASWRIFERAGWTRSYVEGFGEVVTRPVT